MVACSAGLSSKSGNEEVYSVPKGTHVTGNFEYVQRASNADGWKTQGDEMCLDNWLNEDRTKFVMHNGFVTFGKDCCPCFEHVYS